MAEQGIGLLLLEARELSGAEVLGCLRDRLASQVGPGFLGRFQAGETALEPAELLRHCADGGRAGEDEAALLQAGVFDALLEVHEEALRDLGGEAEADAHELRVMLANGLDEVRHGDGRAEELGVVPDLFGDGEEVDDAGDVDAVAEGARDDLRHGAQAFPSRTS